MHNLISELQHENKEKQARGAVTGAARLFLGFYVKSRTVTAFSQYFIVTSSH